MLRHPGPQQLTWERVGRNEPGLLPIHAPGSTRLVVRHCSADRRANVSRARHRREQVWSPGPRRGGPCMPSPLLPGGMAGLAVVGRTSLGVTGARPPQLSRSRRRSKGPPLGQAREQERHRPIHLGCEPIDGTVATSVDPRRVSDPSPGPGTHQCHRLCSTPVPTGGG